MVARWSLVCSIFCKLLMKVSNCLKIPLPKAVTEIGYTRSKVNLFLITITLSMNIQIDKFLYRSDLETTILASVPPKCLNYKVINLYLRNFSNSNIANITNSSRTKQVWTSWEQLRCVAFSSLTVGMTIAVVDLLRLCMVRGNCVLRNLAYTKRHFKSWQKWFSVFSMQIHVSGSEYSSWTTNNFIFLKVWPREIHFRWKAKIIPKCYWNCDLSKMLKRNVRSPFNH